MEDKAIYQTASNKGQEQLETTKPRAGLVDRRRVHAVRLRALSHKVTAMISHVTSTLRREGNSIL